MLLYGEWLAERERTGPARIQLRAAHELFSSIGAGGFAGRAARGLRATGARAASGAEAAQHRLTAQELNIARLVAAGATSPEVGAQLFLSPRTVDAHLRSIFRKLGLTSRRQLKGTKL
jgi:DNA-binding CsgD family transcriptional regulator